MKKPLTEWTDDELLNELDTITASADLGFTGREAAAELMKRAAANTAIDADMANACLNEIRDTLTKLGCRCGPSAHTDTPAMMYPEWVVCCVRAAAKKAAARAKEECSTAADPDGSAAVTVTLLAVAAFAATVVLLVRWLT